MKRQILAAIPLCAVFCCTPDFSEVDISAQTQAIEEIPTWKREVGGINQNEFFRYGNQVVERSSDSGNEVFTYDILSEDSEYVTMYEPIFKHTFKMPVSSTGQVLLSMVWPNNGNQWSPWRTFTYLGYDGGGDGDGDDDNGNPCESDTEPPVDSASPSCWLEGQTLVCKGFLSRHRDFPVTMLDYSFALKYEVVDNCDDDLTYTQLPAPGTIVPSPTTFALIFTATDDHGNQLNITRVIRFEQQGSQKTFPKEDEIDEEFGLETRLIEW